MLSNSRSVLFVAGALLLGGSLAPAHAQATGGDANRDVVVAPSDVGGIVDRVQKLTGQFKNSFDKAVSHSMLDGTRLETNAKRRADELHDAANKLGDVFHDKKDKNNPAVREQADKTIAAASELNRLMADHRFTDRLQNEWSMLRSDLNGLAIVYGLTPLEGGNPASSH
jgi:hypothetical protein